jgi:hypothetical protein
MRLRDSKGWAVTVLLASVGCGQTRGVSGGGVGAAGGGNDDEPPEMALDFAQSGSRLVALGYSSNEARVFRTFHDSQLGFDCDFVPDAAGEYQRCVPSDAAGVVYTDAGCSAPAAWDAWAPSAEAWVPGDVVSGAPSDVAPTCPGDPPPHRDSYRVAEQLSEELIGGPAFDLFELREGQCVTAGLPAKITPSVYRLTPLDESELARGERVSLNVGDGLRLTRLIADDGAALSVGVTDAHGTPCEFQRDGECVPEPIARLASVSFGRYGGALNADCTEPAFLVPYPLACGTAKFGVEDDGAQPQKVRSLDKVTSFFSWDLALPITDPLTYTCSLQATHDSYQVAAPGRDLTGTLPTASKLRRGSGPLHVDWYSVGQSELLPVLADFRRASPGVVPLAEFVNDAGQACQVTPADDGTLHCAVFDDSGHAIADLSTFPEVVSGPL